MSVHVTLRISKRNKMCLSNTDPRGSNKVLNDPFTCRSNEDHLHIGLYQRTKIETYCVFIFLN